VLAAGVLLAACGESEQTSSTAQTTTKVVVTPRCQRAGTALLPSLRASLRDGVNLKRVSVVKVDGVPDAPVAAFRRGVYAVAALLTGPGMDGTIGIWAVSAEMVRTGGGMAIGADAVTREFSDLGSAASSGSPAAEYADQVAGSDAGQRAIACAKG